MPSFGRPRPTGPLRAVGRLRRPQAETWCERRIKTQPSAQRTFLSATVSRVLAHRARTLTRQGACGGTRERVMDRADDRISDNIEVVPVVVVSQTFPARPSSIPD